MTRRRPRLTWSHAAAVVRARRPRRGRRMSMGLRAPAAALGDVRGDAAARADQHPTGVVDRSRIVAQGGRGGRAVRASAGGAGDARGLGLRRGGVVAGADEDLGARSARAVPARPDRALVASLAGAPTGADRRGGHRLAVSRRSPGRWSWSIGPRSATRARNIAGCARWTRRGRWHRARLDVHPRRGNDARRGAVHPRRRSLEGILPGDFAFFRARGWRCCASICADTAARRSRRAPTARARSRIWSRNGPRRRARPRRPVVAYGVSLGGAIRSGRATA